MEWFCLMIRRGKSSLVQIILSLSVVSLLPILVITFYLYPRVNHLVVKEVVNIEKSNLEDIRKNMDKELEEFNKLPIIIGQEYKLSEYTLNKTEYNRYIAVNELTKYIASNLTIEKIYLWYTSMDYMVSNSGVITIKKFQDNYVPLELLEIGDIVNVDVKPDHYRSVLFVLPSLTGEYKVIIEVKEEKFKEIIFISDNQEDVIILNYKNEVVIGSKNYETSWINEVIGVIASIGVREPERWAGITNSQISDLKSDSTRFSSIKSTIQEINYQISYEQSQVTNGISYIKLTPYNKVLSEIIQQNQFTILLIGLLILAEAILIYVLAGINYKPLRQLMFTLIGKDYRELKENEFQTVQKHINQLMVDYKYVYKHNLIRDIINGKIKTTEAFNDLGKAFELELKGNYYNITMMRFAWKSIGVLEQIPGIDKIGFPLNKGITGDFTYGFNENTLLFLSCATKKEDTDQFLKSIYEVLSFDKRYRIYIGKSNTYSNLKHMNDAYIEALSVVEYQMFNHREGVMNYDLVPRMGKKNTYPLERMYHFRTMLLRNELIEANKEFGKLIVLAKYEQNNIMLSRMILYNMYRIICEFNHVQDDGDEQALYAGHTTVEAMIRIVESAYKKIQVHNYTGEMEVERNVITDILLYVNNNYTNVDLSLQVLSGIFDMTQSNFSHYFKSHTNFGFKEYLNQLRIDKSKELLREDRTIKDIAAAVGFASSATFTRNFKQHVGVTPTQYKTERI